MLADAQRCFLDVLPQTDRQLDHDTRYGHHLQYVWRGRRTQGYTRAPTVGDRPYWPSTFVHKGSLTVIPTTASTSK